MKHHDSSEMYLKTILLLEINKGEAHAKEIAEMLNVSKASVTKAINGLKLKGYVQQDNYGPIFLTDEGREISTSILYKQKLLIKYLEQELNLSSEEAEENACRMEHIITDKMLHAIEEKIESSIEDSMQFGLVDKGV